MNAPPPVFVRLLSLAGVLLLAAGCGDDAASGGSDASTLDDGGLPDGGSLDDGDVDGDQGGNPPVDQGGGSEDQGNGPEDQGSEPVDQGGSTGASLSDIVDAETWAEMFPNRNALYSYSALIAAAEYYPAFGTTGTLTERRRELAAFLGNIAHETTGGWPTAPGGAQAWGLYFIQEVGCESGGCTGYCQASAEYPCASGQTYHGRGPIQLSWNYNYGQVGQVLGLDLLNQPSLVTSNGTVAFRTALWFWMTAQSPKPSAHAVMTGGWTPSSGDTAAGRTPGFGMTINIINGGLECDRPTDQRVEDRVAYFQRFAGILETTVGSNLYCDQMDHY